MSDPYEYFVKAAPPYTEERPSGLWRRLAGRWEYLSLLDWEWHAVSAEGVTAPPAAEVLYPVPAERAAALEADRQGWVRYWAYYFDEAEWRDGEEPTTVVRRRRSPERIYDETFMRTNEWQPDSVVYEFFHPRGSNPPHLVEIGVDEAERLLQEIRGVTGATEL
ncbi:hypothetical protein AF335_13495 [Streptomyces eurocidicus]|uniref:Uncharacterized protein n=1 Tax=Streptomyces eurocidicus TaxID=66423 RepID=A0A2N8NYH8_STREU|nr:hypothetical protein [Streptomyces eurocidicus]MBB5121365.1 hypothetical protein [Streptomyces eurocidicus]MBF6050970.1 hypothetical protein [Streptomyces eurocidicus]PNE33808.1 hypothetical protein AF335_13495 [Streptomyces eurocidicus]